MMRWSLVSLSLLLVAGCTDPAPAPADTDPVADETGTLGSVAFPASIAQGTETWRSPQPIGFESMVFQMTGFCLNKADQTVMDWMFPLSQRFQAAPIPNGTTALELTVTWAPTDYAGDTLRFVARPTGSEEYSIVLDLASGEPLQVPVTPEQWDAGDSSGWDMWLCTAQATPDVDPRLRPTAPFVGDVDVELLALA